MHRLIPSALFLLWSAAAIGQDVPVDGETDEPELRRYSVELIVFAYAEDVSVGSELFIPETIEVERPIEPEPDVFGDEWLTGGELPDDSQPADDEATDDSALPDGVFENPEGGYVNEAGEAVDEFGEVILAEGVFVAEDGSYINEAGETVDQYGEVYLADGVFPMPDGGYVNEIGETVNQFGELLDEDGNVIVVFDPYETVLFAEEELTMIDMFDRLDRLDAYEPLLHVGWAQPALPQEETETLTVETFGIPVDGLDGAFTLYLSRYLHLVVELDLAAERGADVELGEDGQPRELSYEEVVARYGVAADVDRRPGSLYEDDTSVYGMSPAAPGERGLLGDSGDDVEGLQSDIPPSETVTVVLPLKYSIRENRIVASGDVRYFDHPKFGVIARVERVELPEEPAEEDGEAIDDTTVLLPVSGQ